MVCTQKLANASTDHNRIQLAIVPEAVLNSPNAIAISTVPISPTRRGPIRSTISPIGSAATAAAPPTMVNPTDACARVQPNSSCSGA